jgi:hypothetical protein
MLPSGEGRNVMIGLLRCAARTHRVPWWHALDRWLARAQGSLGVLRSTGELPIAVQRASRWPAASSQSARTRGPRGTPPLAWRLPMSSPGPRSKRRQRPCDWLEDGTWRNQGGTALGFSTKRHVKQAQSQPTLHDAPTSSSSSLTPILSETTRTVSCHSFAGSIDPLWECTQNRL